MASTLVISSSVKGVSNSFYYLSSITIRITSLTDSYRSTLGFSLPLVSLNSFILLRTLEFMNKKATWLVISEVRRF